jgi:GT2 family glycosyltransferase
VNELVTGRHTVTIIIINYNSSHYTLSCVESITAHVASNLLYNIIIVDNNSEENDFNILSEKCEEWPHVTLVRSVLNLGFSGGNMLGVQHANADYLLFLNNDTIFLNDNVSLFLEFMQAHSNVGICTGQMYNGDGLSVSSFQDFPAVAQRIFGAKVLRLLSPNKYPDNRIIYVKPQKVDVVSGASIFVDFNKFAEVGGFDTNYFLFCEEEDIAKKLSKAGYFAYLVPDAKYVHYVGKSTTSNLNIEKEFYISYFYYLRKHITKIGYTIIVLYCFLKSFMRFFKGLHYLRLAFFILSFPGLEHSLRHKQQIRNK